MEALREILALFEFKVNSAPLRKGQQASDKFVRSIRKGTRATTQMVAGQGMLSKSLQRLTSDFKTLGLAYLGFKGVQGVVTLSDEYVRMQNRLKVVTKGTNDLANVSQEMFGIARETRQPVKNAAEMFQRYSIATQSLGTSQKDVIKLTTALVKGTLLSGTSAESAKGSIIQLAQGLGTNFEAAGQEIRSIQENAPLLAQIIAKAAGGTSEQLMKLAKEGKITSKIVVDSILAAGDDLDEKFANQQILLSEGATRLRTVALKALGTFNAWSTALGKLAIGLVSVANVVEDIIDSNWTENMINVALMVSGYGAVKLLSMGFASLVNQLGLIRAWGYVFSRMLGGWLPMLGKVAVMLGKWLARFILIPLAIEDFIGFLRGNRSLVGDLLAKWFGKDTAQVVKDGITNVLKSIPAVFRIFRAMLNDEGIDKDDVKLMRDLTDMFDGFGEWIAGRFIQGFTDGLSKMFNATIERFLDQVNNGFGTNFEMRDLGMAGVDKRLGPVAPEGPGPITPADAVFKPVARISTGGGRAMTITDNRTTTINAGSGATAQVIAAETSKELTRDRRAIAAAVTVAGRR